MIVDIYIKGVWILGYDVFNCCKIVWYYNVLGKMIVVRVDVYWGISCIY